MNEAMTKYLESLDLTQAVKDRLDAALEAFNFLSDEPILEIFLTDQIDSDDQRKYVDLWGVTQSFLLWSRDFLHNENADISPYNRSISYLSIQYEKLPFDDEVHLDARLTVEVQTAGRIYNELFATGTNAGELRRLVEQFLKPNIRKGLPDQQEYGANTS